VGHGAGDQEALIDTNCQLLEGRKGEFPDAPFFVGGDTFFLRASVPPCETPQYGSFPASIIFFATTRRASVVFIGCVLVECFAPFSMV
jgi:hypothetical protein